MVLRPERDAGTEGVIARRLRNIKALGTRVDLTEMLDDPWRVRRASGQVLDDEQQADAYFADLDAPKQKALLGLWSTSPSFFVVGPPGVGKTRLATETVRRRFEEDRSTRLLLTAQGHDALDHLQKQVKATPEKTGLDDVIIVRSTASDRRPASDEDVHRAGLDYLKLLSESPLTRGAPVSIRERVHALAASARRVTKSKDAVDRDERVALNAVSSLVLDAVAGGVLARGLDVEIDAAAQAGGISRLGEGTLLEPAQQAVAPAGFKLARHGLQGLDIQKGRFGVGHAGAGNRLHHPATLLRSGRPACGGWALGGGAAPSPSPLAGSRSRPIRVTIPDAGALGGLAGFAGELGQAVIADGFHQLEQVLD